MIQRHWEKLSSDSLQYGSDDFDDRLRIVQVSWLLLVSIYEGQSQVTCYYRLCKDDAPLELLSLAVTKSSSLQDHMSQIVQYPFDGGHGYNTPRHMLCIGAVTEAEDWITQSHHDVTRTEPKVVLIMDTSLSINALHLLFKPSVTQAEFANGLFETLKTIISAIANFPACTLGNTNLLSDHDRHRIIAWNRPKPGPALETTIPSCFLQNVHDFSDSLAIYAWDGQMTYRELDLESSRIASVLRSVGPSGPHGMVLFNMKKSKWALVAALAILKAGKAIVPVDPAWPPARLGQVVEITAASVAVCDGETCAMMEQYSVKTVVVPICAKDSIHSKYAEMETLCRPSDLAFVLFSSGSTGIPKGMLRQHDTASTGSFAHAAAMHLGRHSRVLQFANHVFDVAMLDFFTTLLVGGCVCIPSEVDRKNGLAEFVQKSQANWALLTPTVAELLDPSTVPSLKFITLGGESIRRATLQKWSKSCRVGINYGSAEVDVTHVRDVLHNVDVDVDVSNIGHRLPSCTAYIVDPEDPSIVLPIGAVGELVISGPTMAREYLNAPGKTAEVFVPVPDKWYAQGIVEKSGSRSMSRIYRMGDLFRQQIDGSLQFVGRKDFQVKVNGQKVELGDVESKLAQHSQVKHCAVVYPAEGAYASRVVAVVQTERGFLASSRQNSAANGKGSKLTLQTMTEFLQDLLPSFMIPSVLIGTETMPFTPTMKIDRTRLKQWLSQDDILCGSLGAVTYISTALHGPELSPEETQARDISTLIADVVATRDSTTWESISGHDNLFVDMGISSAQTMRLASLIRKRYGKQVLVETLSDPDMSIRKLAARLASVEVEARPKNVHAITKEKSEFLKDRVTKSTRSVFSTCSTRNSCSRHVFLTGATGYLGVQILCYLLKSSNLESVTVLVRGSGTEQALKRVQAALRAVGDHEDGHVALRAWPGDLSKPRLGLSEDHWNQLSGITPSVERTVPPIDSIIHCGAVVDWIKTYNDLEAANVGSTEELLKLTKVSDTLQSFIFVSGGRYPDPARDETRDIDIMYEDAARDSGYSQTKFVAERLVDNARSARPIKSISIVCPAYLIGSRHNGLANQDDYLWRIVWASLRIGAFNADEVDQWLFVAPVDAVAECIVALRLLSSSIPSSAMLKVHDGLRVGKFWSIISETLAVPLAALPGDLWLQRIRSDMEQTSDHLLWPLSDTLDAGRGLLTRQRCVAANSCKSSASDLVELALRSNVVQLSVVGFFSDAHS